MFSNSMSNEHPIDTTEGSHKQINIIGKGTVIEGTIETQYNIRIGGAVYGEVKSSGRVVVGEEGWIEGDLHAASADIAGRVQGEVYTEERLIIRESALIKGNIRTEQLAVEEGGRFTGNCKMQEDEDGRSWVSDDQKVLDSEMTASEANEMSKGQSAAAA